jgi:two-component system cell cycle response regulator
VTAPGRLAGTKVLVADDDATLVGTLTWILKEQGCQVVAVPDGQNLLERLRDERPDLVLLDIMMPMVDGLQLLQRIRSEPEWQDLPVLMISSMDPEDGTAKALGLGASDFVAKPFRVKELLARVESQLKRGRELRMAREESRARGAIADILHELTDSVKSDEIYQILARRVARALNISRCSLVLAKPGDVYGTVVAAYENPMLRNLRIELARYPEMLKALETDQPVIIGDVPSDPLFVEVRAMWARSGTPVPTQSVVALPFRMREEQCGVLYLRTVHGEALLGHEDAQFADTVIKAAVAAIEKAHDFETVVSDKERLEFLAATDALTGCLNRRALLEAVAHEVDRARRYNLVLALLMVDLDHFKRINDTLGHLVGDTVLRQLGEMLLRDARSVDAVARYGGEEFVILLPETAAHGAMMFADRMRQRIANFSFGEPTRPVRITVSVGVACFPDPAVDTPESFIALADAALYRAKADGRNVVRQ